MSKSQVVPAPLHDLSEEQKNSYRKIAFYKERTNPGAIKEAAAELGEHPLVIGGGSIEISRTGESFKKGDVQKIFADAGKVWDGSITVPGQKPRVWTNESALKRREEVIKEIDEAKSTRSMVEMAMNGLNIKF